MVTKKAGLIVVVIFVALLANADILRAQHTRDMFRIGTRYLDGTAFDPDTDILRLDESLYLSIYVEEFFFVADVRYRWILICDPSLATITGGVLGPDARDGYIYDYTDPDGFGRYGWFEVGYPHVDPGLYADNFLYTPQSLGDVTIEFWGCGNLSGEMELDDSIVIHQVPEPMTIALLGLGALLLHRRREKWA